MPKAQSRTRTVATLAGVLGFATIALVAGGPPSNLAHGDVATDSTVLRRADADPGRKILISLKQRRLWLVVDGDTVFSAPVAIGKGTVFQFRDNTYRFATPKGERRVQSKQKDPEWVPPDWHYYEKAQARGLKPVHLKPSDRIKLSDGTFIEVRGKRVGRINRWGNWWPFTPGSEIIFDRKIFIPPMGSPQRMIPNALGPVSLSLGGGYLIHGTHYYNIDSIGDAASHGCIRMHNRDVVKLARMVDVGTPVYIY